MPKRIVGGCVHTRSHARTQIHRRRIILHTSFTRHAPKHVCTHACARLQVREILGKMGEGRQTLLFSATLPRSLADFASAGLSAPVLVRLDAERRISPDLRLAFLTARADEKVGGGSTRWRLWAPSARRRADAHAGTLVLG